MTKFQFNLYFLAKISISFLAGVQLKSLSESEYSTKVKLSLLRQNPFNSIF
jgi:hypothetical protein